MTECNSHNPNPFADAMLRYFNLLAVAMLLVMKDHAAGQLQQIYEEQLQRQPPIGAGRALNADRLSMFVVDPGIAGWPVIMSGIYDDPSFNPVYLIYQWGFSDIADQSCTQGGRIKVLPCRGVAVEKTFDTSARYTITLSVTYPGAASITVSRQIFVTETFGGPTVTRRDYRSLSRQEWDQLIQGFLRLKKLGIWDHMTYMHQVLLFLAFLLLWEPPQGSVCI